MPGSLARFPVTTANPTGQVAPNGHLYVILSGPAAILSSVTPTLLHDLGRLGNAEKGFMLNDLLDALGRTTVFDAAVLSKAFFKFFANAARLGQVLDILMDTARWRGAVPELREWQLRSWLSTLMKLAVENRRASESDFRIAVGDLVELNALTPTIVELSSAESSGGASTPQPVVLQRDAPVDLVMTVEPFVVPAEAEALTYEMVCPSGTMGTLGPFEKAMGPRVLKAARGVKGGPMWLFNTVLATSLKGLIEQGFRTTVEIPEWMDAEAACGEVARAFALNLPSRLLEGFAVTLLEARRELVERLALGAPLKLSSQNVVRVVDHFPPLITILGGKWHCTAAASEVWDGVRTLAHHAKLSVSELVEGDFSTLSELVLFVVPRFTVDEDVPTLVTDRVALTLRLLTAKAGTHDSAPKGDAGPDALLKGYAKHYHSSLYELLENETFVRDCSAVREMIEQLTSRGAGEDGVEVKARHPHEIISFIIEAKHAPMVHALFGVKDEVPALPVVKLIADHLRAHGPTFLGQLGFEMVMPLAMQGESKTRTYPKLDKMWKELAGGSVAFDLENDFKSATLAHYSKKPVAAVPASDVYGSFTRNTSLKTRVGAESTGLFGTLGFSGFEAVLQEGLEYFEEASMVTMASKKKEMQAFIQGVLDERSVIFARDLKKGDPCALLFGPLVVPASLALSNFQTARLRIAPAVETADGLITLGLGHLLPALDVVPEDLPAERPGGRAEPAPKLPPGLSPPAEGEEVPEGGKGGDKAAEEAARIAAHPIGSRKSDVTYDQAAGTLKFSGAKAETYPTDERFREAEGVTKTACAAVWQSKSKVAWVYCPCPDKKGHKTTATGAHWVPPNWRKRMLCTLIIASAPSGSGAVLGPSPMGWAARPRLGSSEPRTAPFQATARQAQAMTAVVSSSPAQALLAPESSAGLFALAGLADTLLEASSSTSEAPLAKIAPPSLPPLMASAAPMGEGAPMMAASPPSPPPLMPSAAPVDVDQGGDMVGLVGVSQLPSAGQSSRAAAAHADVKLAPADPLLPDHLPASCAPPPPPPLMPCAALPGGSAPTVHASPPSPPPLMPSVAGLADDGPSSVPRVVVAPGASFHVLVPIVLAGDEAYVGLPAGPAPALFGCARGQVSREVDFLVAGKWARSLFPDRRDLCPFYFFQLEQPDVVVSGVLASAPPPAGWEADAVYDSAGLASAAEGTLKWVPYRALELRSSVRARVAGIAVMRADTFRKPTSAIPDEAITGAMGEHHLEPRQVYVAAKARVVPAETVMARAEGVMSDLRWGLSEAVRCAEEANDELVREDLRGWLEVAHRPVALGEMDPALHEQYYTAEDPRLAWVSYPYISAVATAPLPPMPSPPPVSRVPHYAKGWKQVLRPRAYAAALRCQRQTRSFYRHVYQHGTVEGATFPRFFACGADSCYPWAEALVNEGHVLIRSEGRITLRDLSQPPGFTISPEGAAQLLEGSKDAALRDAMTTHGIVFYSNALAAQLVMMPPMRNIGDGLESVMDTMRKMVGLKWFTQTLAGGLDNDELELGGFPGRFQAVGCVPRSYSDVMRMIINNSYPHKPMFTTVGERASVVSLNQAINAYGDRAIRKGEELERLAAEAGGAQPVKQHEPSVVSVQGLAKRAEYHVPARLPGSGGGAAVLPPELKPFFFELMTVIVLMAHVGGILGLEPVIMSDDLAKFFHQFALSHLQRWTSHIMMLGPEDDVHAAMEELLSTASARELSIIDELCMSMGTSPSSNWGQRYMTEFMHSYVERFHREHTELYDMWACEVPAFAKWRATRAAVEQRTGRCEVYLLYGFCFTDDPCIVTLCSCSPVKAPLVSNATVLVVDGVIQWGSDCRRNKLMRGEPCKRHLGVQGPWIGGNVFTTGLIGYLGKSKMLRAGDGVRAYKSGRQTVAEFRKLRGLLHHIVFTVALPRHVMYNLCDGLDRMQAAPTTVEAPLKFLFLCGGPTLDSDDDLIQLGAHRGVVIVNYDLANGVEYDLHNATTRADLLARIAAREFTLVFGAPLCRSYSIRGRRLRTRRQPRGVDGLSTELQLYVDRDTSLALFVVSALEAADDADVCWGLEHPSPRWDRASHAWWPKYKRQGTLFDDEATLALGARTTAAYFDAAQCFMGSEYQKYTRILGHRHFIAELKPRMHGGEKCVCRRHAKVATGFDEDGEFKSRAAAYYPVAMKVAIIESGVAAAATVAREAEPGCEVCADDTRFVPVTERSRTAADEWLAALGSRSGTSMLGVIFHAKPPPAVVRHRLHSDAAVVGTNAPAIAGNLYERRYVFPLAGTEYLKLPIVALEFAGEGPLNLLCFGPSLLNSSVIALPCDSLVAPLVFASRARTSKLLMYMHSEFLKLPIVQELYPRLVVSQEYGVGNPVTDHDSRGRHNEAEELLRHMQLTPCWTALPSEAYAYMDRVMAYFHTLPQSERALEMLYVTRKQYAQRKAAEEAAAEKAMVMLHREPDGGECDAAAPGGPAYRFPPAARLTAQAGGSSRLAMNPPSHRLSGGGGATAVGSTSAAPRLSGRCPTDGCARGVMAAALLTAATLPTGDAATALGATNAAAMLLRVPPPGRLSARWAPPAAARSATALPDRRQLSGGGWRRQAQRPAGAAHARSKSAPRARVGEAERVVRIPPWEVEMLEDRSAMAILPGNPDALAELLEDMRDSLESCFAPSTNRSDSYHLEAWRQVCKELGTPMWRTDMAANSGLDPVGYRRELILPALAFLKMYARMSPRSRKDPAPKPRSVLQKLYAVAREHKKRGYKMAPFTIVMQVMAGQLRKYVERHGTESLAPARKVPLRGEMILAMLSVPDGTQFGKLTVDWSSYFWVAVGATFSVLAETGMRKGDVSRAASTTPFQKGRLTFGSLKWSFGGVVTAAPTVQQLASLREGDGCWLVYGVLKNDAFGEHFGSKPSWLPFSSSAARNACRALAGLERMAAAAGMVAAQRPTVPLFGPSFGVEWYHSILDSVFKMLLRVGVGLTDAECTAYSVHSFRIYLACALYAAHCPPERIMAILRWKSEEALLIYARMNDSERTGWILKSMDQAVDSSVAAHLPRIDPDEWVASIHASIASGELGKAARDADLADEADAAEF